MLLPVQTAEKRIIRRQSNLAGLALLLTAVLSVGLAFVLSLLQVFGLDLGLATDTVNGVMTAVNPNGYLLTNLVFYAAVMGIPALVGWLLLRSSGLSVSVDRPIKGVLWAGYLVLGMGLCVFANTVAYGSNVVFALFSLYPAETPVTADGTWLNWLLSLISTAVLPAILEELLFRGVAVTLLKPAGDRAAVLVSAIVFALAHGTLTQIPFAFVLGLMFAYLYLRTGSLLLTMVLHFLNNAMAVTAESLLVICGEETTTVLVYLVYAVLALFGVAAAVFLQVHADHPLQPLGDRVSSLSLSARFHTAMFAPVMLVFAVVSLCMLPMNVEYDPTRMEETAAVEETPEDGGNESAVIAWR